MIFRAHDGQSHFDSRATLPCKSQVRLTRDKCSKQIQFCSVPRTLHVRAAGADCLCNWGSNRSAYCWPAENKRTARQRVRPAADLKRAKLRRKWSTILRAAHNLNKAVGAGLGLSRGSTKRPDLADVQLSLRSGLSCQTRVVTLSRRKGLRNEKLHSTNRSDSIAGHLSAAGSYAVGSTPNTSVVVLWLP